MKLDDVVDMFDLPKPTKIKIDVDFNELQVIQGADNTLDYVSELYVELNMKLEEHEQVVEFLKEKSLEVTEVKEELSRSWNPGMANYLFTRTR